MFFNWVIFVDRGASQNAGLGSGERAEPALRRPWFELTKSKKKTALLSVPALDIFTPEANFSFEAPFLFHKLW